ncbi:MAG: FAD-dependent oxidoreductase [Thermoplasmatales archaeon]|nr:MAG: FAD-dependent oxidoreductase [Thermoplasmatales archaeon]
MTGETKIVIIGCGAGGGTTAQFARKTDRKAIVTIFERGKYPQYSKCGLPYVISGKIPEFKELIEFSEDWFEKERIDLFLETTVDEINKKNHTVFAKKGNERIKKEFDKLILATGATPSIPPIKNIKKNGELIKGAHVLRTIDDGKLISSDIKKGKKATILGAGLIGLEMVDALSKKEMDITVVEALPEILGNALDNDMCEPTLRVLQEKTTLYTNHVATKVSEEHGTLRHVFIKDNKTNEEKELETDVLVIAVGTKPNVSLAKSIGCKLGETGRITINEKSETSVKNVYAVGDCTEYKDFVTQKAVGIGLGSIVVRQGIAAGVNAAGGNYILPKGVLLTRTSEIFGVEVAAVGPVKNAFEKMPVIYGKFKGSSLPEYFPGGNPITIKVGVHEETGRIVSAQAVGSNAAQRVNVFACAIFNGANVEDVKKLETAYAPPIAPPLDALTLACDVASLKLARKKD